MNSGTVDILMTELELFSSFKELTHILIKRNLIDSRSKVTNVVIYYELNYSDALMKIDWMKE